MSQDVAFAWKLQVWPDNSRWHLTINLQQTCSAAGLLAHFHSGILPNHFGAGRCLAIAVSLGQAN
jgi:hypothetical protein